MGGCFRLGEGLGLGIVIFCLLPTNCFHIFCLWMVFCLFVVFTNVLVSWDKKMLIVISGLAFIDKYTFLVIIFNFDYL